MVVLRKALPDDVYAMAHIEHAAFSDPWPASGFRELLAASAARVTIADRAGTIVGYTVMMIAADEAELANIAVRDTERGLGLGRRLLDAALAAAVGEGVRWVYLEVRESNAAARGLYTSAGFTVIGRRARYYDKPTEDALLMRWDAPA